MDSKDSGIEEGREEDSGDVLWDLHDEQEQTESYQQACNSTTSKLGFQKVGQIHNPASQLHHLLFNLTKSVCN